jgi:hypothetical protein
LRSFLTANCPFLEVKEKNTRTHKFMSFPIRLCLTWQTKCVI